MIKAKAKANNPVNGKIQNGISVLTGYLSRYTSRSHQANGAANRKANMTNLVNSIEISLMMLNTDAPITLRTPISLVRCSVVYAAKPNNPKPVMMMVNVANKLANLLLILMVEKLFLKLNICKSIFKRISWIVFFKYVANCF